MSRKRDNKGRYVKAETKGEFLMKLFGTPGLFDSNDVFGDLDVENALSPAWLKETRSRIESHIETVRLWKRAVKLAEAGEVKIRKAGFDWGVGNANTRIDMAVLNYNGTERNLAALDIDCGIETWREMELKTRLNYIDNMLCRKLTQLENRLKWFDEPMPE